MDHLVDTQEYLNRLPIFSGAPAGVVKLFAYLAKEEEYPRREILVNEGEDCDRFFLILSGRVEIFQFHKGRRFHLQLLSAEKFNYFGELALLTEFKWFFSAMALTDIQLLTISREAFSKVMERFPEFYQIMVQRIITIRIERFVDQNDYLMDNISPGAWREYPPESEWK